MCVTGSEFRPTAVISHKNCFPNSDLITEWDNFLHLDTEKQRMEQWCQWHVMNDSLSWVTPSHSCLRWKWLPPGRNDSPTNIQSVIRCHFVSNLISFPSISKTRKSNILPHKNVLGVPHILAPVTRSHIWLSHLCLWQRNKHYCTCTEYAPCTCLAKPHI